HTPEVPCNPRAHKLILSPRFHTTAVAPNFTKKTHRCTHEGHPLSAGEPPRTETSPTEHERAGTKKHRWNYVVLPRQLFRQQQREGSTDKPPHDSGGLIASPACPRFNISRLQLRSPAIFL
ncbi:unnamed protein product, partial [Ectocarpus sp. 12 AP-2014]